MSLKAVCARCGQKIKAAEHHAGKRVKCPRCQEPLTLPPAPEQPAAEPAVERAFAGAFRRPARRQPGSSARNKSLDTCQRCQQAFPPDQMVRLHGVRICRQCKEAFLIERPSSQESRRKVLQLSLVLGLAGLLVVAALGGYLLLRIANRPAARKPPAKPTAPLLAEEPPPPAADASAKRDAPGKATAPPPPAGPTPKTEPSEPPLPALVYQPQPASQWRFRFEATLGPLNPPEPVEPNRLRGRFTAQLQDHTPARQNFWIVFDELEVPAPFRDEEYRGAASFPKNILGKRMPLWLGPKSADDMPEGVPPSLPLILDAGDVIEHEDGSRDLVGKAFKRYLTLQGNDLTGQVLAFLGRDWLPPQPTARTWERNQPLSCDAGFFLGVAWKLERQPAPSETQAVIGLQAKSEHLQKRDGKPVHKITVTGKGSWTFDLQDSMTHSLSCEIAFDEEDLLLRHKHAYVLRLSLVRDQPSE
jgi:DNA-directed RNA polymerase subunit RPC12/RpoP